jgi:hypothetical protein
MGQRNRRSCFFDYQGTTRTGSETNAENDSSGCAVGGWVSAKTLGPWLLAGLFGAIVMLARRQRRWIVRRTRVSLDRLWYLCGNYPFHPNKAVHLS